MTRKTMFGIAFAAGLVIDTIIITLFSIPVGPLMYSLFGTSFLIAAYTALE